MSPETIAKIQEVFKPVAEKIGQGAQYGWEVVIKQQYINGITSFVVAGVGLLMAIGGGISFAYGMKGGKKDNWCDGTNIFFSFLGGFVFVIGNVILWVNLIDGIQHVLNPAYYALDFFIHLVK